MLNLSENEQAMIWKVRFSDALKQLRSIGKEYKKTRDDYANDFRKLERYITTSLTEYRLFVKLSKFDDIIDMRWGSNKQGPNFYISNDYFQRYNGQVQLNNIERDTIQSIYNYLEDNNNKWNTSAYFILCHTHHREVDILFNIVKNIYTNKVLGKHLPDCLMTLQQLKQSHP